MEHRGRLTSQIAAEKIGDRYDLVLVACRRVRELRAGWEPHIEPVGATEISTALEEIEQGFVGRDYLFKSSEIEHRRKDRHTR
jgi:DNA-directed RNA polymerase subunit omega